MIKQLILTTFMFILTCASDALADERIGTIADIEGSAFVQQTTQSIKLKINDPIYLDDVITTDKGSKLVAMLIDDTQFILAENTSLKIDEYLFNPDKEKKSSAHYDVLKGAFLYISGLLSKGNNADIEITNNFGTIGIRGTTVWGGRVKGKGYGVLVADGQAVFRTKSGNIRLETGQGTFITKKDPYPSRAKVWGEPVMKAALATITLKDQDGLKIRLNAVKEKNKALRYEKDKVPEGFDEEELEEELLEKNLVPEEVIEEEKDVTPSEDEREEMVEKAEEEETEEEEEPEAKEGEMSKSEIEQERALMEEALRKKREERVRAAHEAARKAKEEAERSRR
ncbi:MAG: FecR domain-containing protein [Pseudomonadota bacterium]